MEKYLKTDPHPPKKPEQPHRGFHSTHAALCKWGVLATAVGILKEERKAHIDQ